MPHHISPLIAPIVALVAWSLIVLLWMIVTRGPAMKRAGIDITKIVGGRGSDLEGRIVDQTQWKAHNYSHLMEQPTLFYAIVAALVLMGFDAPINVWLAWAYVGFRIIHSIIQGTINVVVYRFAAFLLSSLCLVALTIHAILFLIHHR